MVLGKFIRKTLLEEIPCPLQLGPLVSFDELDMRRREKE
jgi:hypothetical protein